MQKKTTRKTDYQTVKDSDWLITVWLFNNFQPLQWHRYLLTDANCVHTWFWENRQLLEFSCEIRETWN